MINLTGKNAIVTGGARDIGRAVSIQLARAGANVCINYFEGEEAAKETLQMIQAEGGKAIIKQGDMSIKADVEKVVKACQDAFGNSIDILVNVAGGLFGRKTLDILEEEFWDRVMNVNVKSVFLATQAVVPHMTNGGSIINFTSQAARDGGGPGASAYATAKGAVLTFTRSMAKELGPKGIRVNAVSPGMINTSFHDKFTKPEVRQNVSNATPLRRQGDANEVADLVLYLASNMASFIQGASVEINGGTYFI